MPHIPITEIEIDNQVTPPSNPSKQKIYVIILFAILVPLAIFGVLAILGIYPPKPSNTGGKGKDSMQVQVDSGIVDSPTEILNIRNEPDSTSEKVGRYDKGCIIYYSKHDSIWVVVYKDKNGKEMEGYAHGRYIKPYNAATEENPPVNIPEPQKQSSNNSNHKNNTGKSTNTGNKKVSSTRPSQPKKTKPNPPKKPESRLMSGKIDAYDGFLNIRSEANANSERNEKKENGETIYFRRRGRDIWVEVYDNTGTRKIGYANSRFIMLSGTINSSDGYLNIRKVADPNSEKVDKYYNGNAIYYKLIPNSDWVEVYDATNEYKIGYANGNYIKQQ